MSWNDAGAPFPWREFDPEAKLAFTFDFSDFVTAAGVGLTLASVGVILPATLEEWGAPHSVTGNVLTMRLARSAEPVPAYGGDLLFTLRPVLSDGQQDDRSFILRLRDR